MDNKGLAWWRNSIGYVIYPESFKDSNDDGVGDIRGIVSKLDYLKELGVNLLWICPLFKSPMDDGGYDVSDYRQINPRFGTMEDFDSLLSETHKRGIRIIIDFVLNHTSDEHPWFQTAIRDPGSKERGYYFFRQGRKANGKELPPNNWKGFFSTSAWERLPDSDLYYLHIFSRKMPDVNWANPELRERYFEIARFYLDKGVDGFRLDAVAHLAKDLSFADSAGQPDEDGFVYDTSKFSNRPELFDYLQMLKKNVFSHYDCLTVGEAGGNISPQDALKMADRENGSINLVFNFDTVWDNGNYGSIDKDDQDIRTDVISLKDNFMRWYDVCHERADMPLYWCNHDHPRLVSQYGSIAFRAESAKMLFNTILFLYGTPFIYNGEEIGMSNVNYARCEDFYSDVGTRNDVASLRARGYDDGKILGYLNRTSRVNARTPMQWDRTPYAGFSAHHGINRVNDNYLSGVNVADEMADPWSILNFYQYAIGLRKDPVINEQVLEGRLEIVDHDHPDVFAYLHDGKDKLMVISNFRPYQVCFSFYYALGDVLLHNYDQVLLSDHVFALRPFETYLLRLR
ncbi:MAG: alpha-glucosidase [Bacilli bacterium]|jgi:glycosidase|nr:alpha-glucosidase [Bacilli bacterium]